MDLYYQPNIAEGFTHLDADESRHCVKVLRKKTGDGITVTDGRGFFYDAVIMRADSRQCSFEIRQKREAAKRDFYIHIAISPTRNLDRIEWFVEKATELGVDRITLIECHHTGRSNAKVDRLRKIAIAAMKQSLKAELPLISEGLLPFADVVHASEETHKCIAHVDFANPSHLRDTVPSRSSYLVMIGPEGDFTPEELDIAIRNAFRKVSLGPARLRTETAGVAACHILNLINN